VNPLRRVFGFDERALDALDLLFFRGDGDVVSRLIPTALLLDDALDALDLAQRVLIFPNGELTFVHLFLHGLAVVADELIHRAVFQLEDAIADLVQKIPVMRNQHKRSAKRGKIGFQPL